MLRSFPKAYRLLVVVGLLGLTAGACGLRQDRRVELQGSTPTLPKPVREKQQPMIGASPVEEGLNNWHIAGADAVTLTVTAPGASEVTILYRPIVADEAGDFVQLRKLIEPTERASGRFQTNLQTSADFAGDVWARATYPDGTEEQTAALALTTRTAVGAAKRLAPILDPNGATTKRANASGTAAPSLGAEESARSDKATGGRVTRVTLREGRPDIRLTVNAPAFLLTLWQDGRELATYPVGIGRREFPLPITEREADKIILNPAWIPPDSSWVRASSGVEPYERIGPADARNPLGKIKIPLGDAYLIHEVADPSDIGSLVSHGCVRMLTADIFDLTQKIARARNLEISAEEIEKAKNDSERRVLALGGPIPVDINYDTAVVEGGTLYLYPDVYERGTATIGRLRDELNANGVDASRLDDATLREMIGRTSETEKFVVRFSDIRRGRALKAGRTESIVAEPSPTRRAGA